MDPITKSIDKIEEILGHSPHPAIVMLPLGAFAVSNISDGLALATGDERYDPVADVSMAIGLVGAAASAVTGLRDYGYIPKDRQPNHRIATTHALGNMAVGSLFAASYILRKLDQGRGDPPRLTVRLLGLAGGALALYTGYLGGKLVEEYGEGVHPVMDRLSEQEEHHELPAGDGGQPASEPEREPREVEVTPQPG